MSGQVLFQDDAVIDAFACQEYLQLLGSMYGAEVFFFSELEGVCYLLDSPDRLCLSMSGPAAPSVAECEEETTTSTTTTTTSTTITTTTLTTTSTTAKPEKSCKFLEKTSLTDQVNQSLVPDAVLISGGYNSPLDTAELYVPSTGLSCTLPRLPDNRYSHSLESSGLLCGGDVSGTSDICLQWSPESGSWTEELHLNIKRSYHVSWTPDNSIGTYLMGGYPSYRTTTLIKNDGTQEAAFPLKYDTS